MKKPDRGISRRQLVTAAAAAPLAAQTQTASDDPLEAARAQTKQTIAELRKTRVPMLLEPTFAFRP